jgi:hypothetical protein
MPMSARAAQGSARAMQIINLRKSWVILNVVKSCHAQPSKTPDRRPGRGGRAQFIFFFIFSFGFDAMNLSMQPVDWSASVFFCVRQATQV